MISKELNAAISNMLVLAVLRKGPSYGYDIQRRIKMQSDGILDWTEGMLYPVLHRLEKNGFVEARWGEAETGRKRKYYHLLPAGEQHLGEAIDAWYTVSDVLINLTEGE
ncbi:PadR family transcriptional regulator [Bowmanella sp. JS7-9]|uniref:PadR family transcriptional regulator n=1 Tax=Alteromonadaceae TaxID=72275 RepID=UPI00103C6574|nr:helix-turn-helix transcriptional regulator [Bowmanella sp. JS7-9]